MENTEFTTRPSSSSEAKDLRGCGTKKLFIDTDIGDAPDDSLSLYMAMRMGFSLVGVTTVFGDTKKRAEKVKKLLSAYGRGYESVPVADGDGAADLIIESCKKYGKDLTVVAIGPFTNIAKVIEKDPNALALAAEVVIMGGAYYRQYADWNVTCDPESAAIMFDSLTNLNCIGADVTHRLDIGKENADIITGYRGDACGTLVAKELDAWVKANPDDLRVLHDPLAVYCAVHPEICTAERVHVAVITEGFGRGMTLNADAYSKAYMNLAFNGRDLSRKAKVAKAVNARGFMDLFMELFR